MDKPLAGLRLVTTLAPSHWFGGNSLARGRGYATTLRELGAEVYEFDTVAVYQNDRARIREQARDLVAFGADAAIGTPHAGYIVQGGMGQQSFGPPGSGALNLFIDELEIPAILFWDHALTQAAHYLLQPDPATPADSRDGACQLLRSLFTHPNIVHLFPDSGHADELGRLGLGSFGPEAWYVQGAGRAFMDTAIPPGANGFEDEAAFFGNIYLAAAGKIPYVADPAVERLRDHVRRARDADVALPTYHAYRDAIAALDPAERERLRLSPDQSFYWRFMHDELSRFTNGETRLRTLQACGRPIAFYGNFNDPDSNALMPANNRPRSVLPYGQPLATQFQRTCVTVDVANATFISGFSVKLVDCFAAGGFALTNRRADIVRAFGTLADDFCYDTTDQLAAKLDFFLTHGQRRLELAAEIASLVRENYSAEQMFARAVPPALERLRKTARRRRLRGKHAALLDRSLPVARPLAAVELSLLSKLDHWTGAAITYGKPIIVRTADAPWSYSAQLPLAAALDGSRATANGPLFWAIDAEVNDGEVGIGLIVGGAISAERTLDAIDGRQTIYLPIGPTNSDLIVRNGRSHGHSRVAVHGVSLVAVAPRS